MWAKGFVSNHVQRAFREIALQISDTSQLLSELDQQITRWIPYVGKIEFAIVRLDIPNHRAEFVCRGSKIVYRSSKTGISLCPRNPVSWCAGDRIVLVTSSLFECKNSLGDEYALSSLTQTMNDGADLDAAEFLRLVTQDIRRHVGGHFPPADIAIAVVHRPKDPPTL
jgi:hypothetical protein